MSVSQHYLLEVCSSTPLGKCSQAHREEDLGATGINCPAGLLHQGDEAVPCSSSAGWTLYFTDFLAWLKMCSCLKADSGGAPKKAQLPRETCQRDCTEELFWEHDFVWEGIRDGHDDVSITQWWVFRLGSRGSQVAPWVNTAGRSKRGEPLSICNHKYYSSFCTDFRDTFCSSSREVTLHEIARQIWLLRSIRVVL